MKKALLVILFFSSIIATAQVKIGENPNTIDANSILELESSNRAFILPRVTTVQMEAMTPLQGAMVYNEDEACIFYYDSVTWKNLCSGSGTGSSSWGGITGTLENQTDLMAEFSNYVDLASPQTIEGEKTFTEKFTVNTGNPNDQIAEFNGRVKGENGTAPEDFVTRLQLDAVTIGGHTGTEGSIFFAGANVAPTEDNDNLFWDNTNKQLRVGGFSDLIDDYQVFSDSLTTLHLQGSISKPVSQATTLTEQDYTTIISWSTFITLPDPGTCFGRIYVNKIRPGVTVGIRNYEGYNDSESIKRREFPAGRVTQIQSNGYAWEQIN